MLCVASKEVCGEGCDVLCCTVLCFKREASRGATFGLLIDEIRWPWWELILNDYTVRSMGLRVLRYKCLGWKKPYTRYDILPQ